MTRTASSLAVLAIAIGHARALSGQSTVAWGAIAGAGGLRDDGSMQALSGLIEYKPNSWWTFSANPSVDRVTASGASSTGLTDLPLGAAISHDLSHAPLSPTLGAGIEVSLPTGNSSAGLGSGQTSLAGELGAGISPTDNLSVDLNIWHPFVGNGVNSALDAPRATSIGLEAGYDWTEHLTTSLGYTADVGPADSGTTAPQSVVAGFVVTLAKPLALTVNGARGLTSGAPRWLVSVGLGTAFSEINPVGPSSLLGLLRHGFGRSANRGHGKGKVGK